MPGVSPSSSCSLVKDRLSPSFRPIPATAPRQGNAGHPAVREPDPARRSPHGRCLESATRHSSCLQESNASRSSRNQSRTRRDQCGSCLLRPRLPFRPAPGQVNLGHQRLRSAEGPGQDGRGQVAGNRPGLGEKDQGVTPGAKGRGLSQLSHGLAGRHRTRADDLDIHRTLTCESGFRRTGWTGSIGLRIKRLGSQRLAGRVVWQQREHHAVGPTLGSRHPGSQQTLPGETGAFSDAL